MYAKQRMRQYQSQAVSTASPDELVAKLYDLGVSACHRSDRAKLRAVLVELMAGLNHEKGGELAGQLQAVYEHCLNESAMGDLGEIGELLDGLRGAWRQGVLHRRRKAAA